MSGYPGQTCFKIIRVQPGLDHVRCEIEKRTIWKCNNQLHYNIHEPRLPFAAIFVVGNKCTRSHTPYFMCIYITIAIYTLHRAMPINPLPLQDSKSATLAVYHGILFYKQHAADIQLTQSHFHL